VIKLLGASSNPWSFLQPTHPMIQTMYKFFACRAGMRSEDPKDRNPRNFDNGSNLNWRGIFLFVVYTSVVVGVFLFPKTEITEALMGQRRDRATTREIVAEADSSFGEKVRTIAARPWFKVSNEGLQLGGPALELMLLIKYQLL
jgi:hypothetical protein